MVAIADILTPTEIKRINDEYLLRKLKRPELTEEKFAREIVERAGKRGNDVSQKPE